MEYKIGDFSLVTRLTVKTLRYYDEVGILTPARTDPDTGYRWYDEASLERATVVKKLRELDFSIAEIADLLKDARDDADLDGALRRKARELDVKMERYARLRSEIALALSAARQDPVPPRRKESSIVDIPEVQAATFRFTGKYNEVGRRFAFLFRLYGRHAGGPPFVLYHDGEYKEEADLEACLPLKAGAAPGQKEGTAVRSIAAVRALEVTHMGPYERIGEAYRRAFNLIHARALEAVVPSREVYLKGPGLIFRGDAKKYVTKVQIALKAEPVAHAS